MIAKFFKSLGGYSKYLVGVYIKTKVELIYSDKSKNLSEDDPTDKELIVFLTHLFF